jgi:hypothetical protein
MSATPNDNTVEATGSIFMRKLNQKGSVLIFLTIGFALLATFVGFALDFGKGYLEKARIARLIDGASLAAAKALKGQSGLENQATRAACDSMAMNGASVVFTGGNTCTETTGAPLKVLVQYFDQAVKGGPPMRYVRIRGTKAVPTTFLNFLSWVAPGDYSTMNACGGQVLKTMCVRAEAEAGPERPVDLMLVLDRSGSMTAAKITAMTNTVNEFLNNNFTGDDRVGLISFASRGCGNATGGDTTVNGPCTPDVPLTVATDANIAMIKNKVSGLDYAGGTNTMEALRTARGPIAAAFNDATRATTRKAVLLVTDGQPTFYTLSNDGDCKKDPVSGANLNDNGNTNAGGGPFTNGCRAGASGFNKPGDRRYMFREALPTATNSCLVEIAGTQSGCSRVAAPDNAYNQTLYKNALKCSRSMIGCRTNGAMHEANEIRKCGYNNSACTPGGAHDVLIFAIMIGAPDNNRPQHSADKNAKCLLSRIANATDVLNTGTNNIETLSTVCGGSADTTVDGDTHADLREGWPCGAGPCIDTTQEKGKVYIVDQNLPMAPQLQQVFAEIAAILKLRLTL